MPTDTQERKKWPLLKFDQYDEPHFLFIISPPYSGSTALAKIINTSHNSMTLTPKGEGQWLVPGLCAKDRWMSEKKVNYQSVKSVWLNKYQSINHLIQNIDVVVEKSPPNMMRLEELASHFKKHSFLANNRDPFANCASMLYRNYNPENLTTIERKNILCKLAEKWILRSLKIKSLIESLNIPLLTYENLCDNPSAVKGLLNLPNGVTDSINPNIPIKVKDYEPQPISNHNERQIAKLTHEEIEQINKVLATDTPLLNFFGYQLLE